MSRRGLPLLQRTACGAAKGITWTDVEGRGERRTSLAATFKLFTAAASHCQELNSRPGGVGGADRPHNGLKEYSGLPKSRANGRPRARPRRLRPSDRGPNL